MAIKNKAGIKLTSPSEMCSRWKEYCSKLYDDNQDDIEIPVTEREPPLTMQALQPWRNCMKCVKRYGNPETGLNIGRALYLYIYGRKVICYSVVIITLSALVSHAM